MSVSLSIIEAAADLHERFDGLFFEPHGKKQNLRPFARASARSLLRAAISEQDPETSGRTLRLIAQISAGFTNVRLRDPVRLPPWASQLQELITHLESIPGLAGLDEIKPGVSNERILFLPLCLLIVRHSVARLKETCASKFLEQLSLTAFRKLQASLASRLLQILAPTASTYFRTCSQDGRATRLKKVPSCSPTTALHLLDLFREFPVLARLVATVASDWEKGTSELLVRLYRDRRRFQSFMGGGRGFSPANDGIVADLDSDLSDLHHGGRTVVALHLSIGDSIVYKPRSCRGEKEWGRMLRSLGHPALRPFHPWVLERDGYGWVEFVRPKKCRSIAEGRLFYRRAGTHLLLAHLSRTVDLHRGNVIAVGSSPVIVDVETLSHPCFRESDFAMGIDGLLLSRTGLLPIFGDNSRGLNGSHALDSETERNSVDQHRPRLRNRFLSASDFAKEIEDGYRSAAIDLYRTRERRRRCARIICRISRQPWRRILRPTAVYGELRRLTIDPSLLRSGLKRHLVILKRCAAGKVPLSIAFAEAAALARFDIPLFSGATMSRQAQPPRAALPSLKHLLTAAGQIANSWKPPTRD